MNSRREAKICGHRRFVSIFADSVRFDLRFSLRVTGYRVRSVWSSIGVRTLSMRRQVFLSSSVMTELLPSDKTGTLQGFEHCAHPGRRNQTQLVM
jgi:hypothetical protein